MRVLLAVALVMLTHASPAAARITQHEVTQDVPFASTLVACLSEPVAVEGTARFVYSAFIDDQTGAMKIMSFASFQGTGVGAVSLAPYTAKGQDHAMYHFNRRSQESVHQVINVHVHGTKALGNGILAVRFKVTISASGHVAATHESTTCK